MDHYHQIDRKPAPKQTNHGLARKPKIQQKKNARKPRQIKEPKLYNNIKKQSYSSNEDNNKPENIGNNAKPPKQKKNAPESRLSKEKNPCLKKDTQHLEKHLDRTPHPCLDASPVLNQDSQATLTAEPKAELRHHQHLKPNYQNQTPKWQKKPHVTIV